VGKEVCVARAENECAAQLERIAAEFVLVVAGGAGTFAALEIVAAKEMKKVGGFQIGNFVGLAVFVDKEGEVDSGFLLEETGVVGIAEADGGQGDVLFAEGLFVLAQLRDVLAAKDSAVVAEEYEDGGVRLPERAKTNRFAKGIGKNNPSEALTEGFRHDGP
jgi:hypothetical protein